MGVPKHGSSKFYALLHSFALFCALLRPFALFCGLAFALSIIFPHLRSFALICVFLHPTAFWTTAFGNCRGEFLLSLRAFREFPWKTLKTRTSWNNEVQLFLLGDTSIWSFSSVSSLSDYSIWKFSLAIIAFGAFGFIDPKYYCCLGKMDKRSPNSLI